MFDKFEVRKNVEIECFFTIFEAYYEKNFSFDGESHDFWEVVYVIDGEIGVAADGKVYTLSQNEIIFHKPMEFHKLWSENETMPRLLIFSFCAKGGMMDNFTDGVFRLSIEQKAELFRLIGFLRQSSPEYSEHKSMNEFLSNMD